jgi:hypothetical protein
MICSFFNRSDEKKKELEQALEDAKSNIGANKDMVTKNTALMIAFVNYENYLNEERTESNRINNICLSISGIMIALCSLVFTILKA